MGDSAPDVAKFQRNLVGQLALNGQVERVHLVGPEIRIQSLSGGCRSGIVAGEVRLRQSRSDRRGRHWGSQAIHTNAKSCRRRGRAFRRAATAVTEGTT